MDEETQQKILNLEPFLKKNVIGQDHVIAEVCKVLEMGETGITSPNRPKGSFLFLGTTGTGKTELAKCFCRYLFGKNAFIRFDMSEFMEKSALQVLLGQNIHEKGRMGSSLEGNNGPISKGVILFDEIEKAHPDILNLLLQILDEGRITVADNTTYNLCGFYFVCTSNIGAFRISEMLRSKFALIQKTVMSEVRRTLRPELIARFTKVLVFKRLSFDTQLEICRLLLGREIERLAELGHKIDIDEKIIAELMDKGFSRFEGARHMRKVIEEYLGHAVSTSMLESKATSGKLETAEQGSRSYYSIST